MRYSIFIWVSNSTGFFNNQQEVKFQTKNSSQRIWNMKDIEKVGFMRSFSILKIFVILVFSSTYCNFVATKTRLKNGITCTTFQLIDEQDFLGIFFTDSCDILKDNHWCAFLMRFTETVSGHIGRSYWKFFQTCNESFTQQKKWRQMRW